jgi:predicted P-loop ATPase
MTGIRYSRCGSIDLGALARERDQLWAEAVARYREGAIWWFDEPELIASAKVEQDQRYHADAWDARIDRWLSFQRRRVNRGYRSRSGARMCRRRTSVARAGAGLRHFRSGS